MKPSSSSSASGANVAPAAAWARWNDTRAAYPKNKGVHVLFAEQARQTPKAVAVATERETLTYAELARRVEELAAELRRRGVGAERLVPLVLERSSEMIVALLGVLEAGGAYVPLDADYPDERLAFLVRDTSATVVLTQAKFAERVRRLAGEGVEVLVVDEFFALRGRRRAGKRETKTPPTRAAYVIYTSGTTGRPKGVVLEHGPLTNRIVWMQRAYQLQQDDRVLQKTPYTFDVSGWEFFWPLMAGARLVFARPEGHKDPEYLCETIRREKITTLHFVPSMLRAFLAAREVRGCTSLRRVICSGEALSVPLKDEFFRVFPDVELHNLYGPTEAAIDVTYYRCRPEDRVVPIGRPIANTQLHILDENLKPVPLGEEGELCLAGDCLARGYLNRPELTAEKFVAHPLKRGAKLYRTGDRARWLPDGNVEYLGRTDHQIKLRGNRIELGEIEATLLATEGVAAAAVVATGGDNEEVRLAAYVVPRETTAPGVFHRVRLAEAGRLEGVALHTLTNGLEVAHLNAGETAFLEREIFERNVYLRHGIAVADGDCVWDVGANIGLFSVSLLTRWRGLRVHAFEPIPEVSRVLEINGELFGGGMTVHACGLSDAAGEAEFVYYPHVSILSGAAATANAADEGATVRAWMQQEHAEALRGAAAEEIDGLIRKRLESRRVRCRLRTISEAMREQGVERIDLLKIDVEKLEERVLAGIEEADWPKIRQIVLEVHDVDGRAERVAGMLRARGYEVVAERDEAMGGAGIFQVYARRSGTTGGDGTERRGAEGGRERAGWYGISGYTRGLREALRAKLPGYMEPNFIVPVAELPLTASGKVDRKALAQRPLGVSKARSAATVRAVRAATPGLAQPVAETRSRAAIETRLIAIWEELLGVVDVGVDDRFFELGGNSLLAVRVADRVGRELGVKLSVVEMLELATVRAIAEHVGGAGRGRMEGEVEGAARSRSQLREEVGVTEVEAALKAHPSIRDGVVVRRGEALVAYAVPDERYFAARRRERGTSERLEQWVSVWERNYRPILEGEKSSAERLNAIGYVRSDSGEQIPERELRECIDAVLEQVMALRPKTLLEIGCGTGMLLFEFASRVKRYVATDLSEHAIAHIQASLADKPFRERVSCYHCDASDLSAVPVEEADTVMINSVIQYFPGIDYLTQLIETLARRLPKKARIFIGDVRDLRLLKAFHVWTLKRQCVPTTTKREFRRLLADRMKLEKELVIHPQYFRGLAASVPRIRQVRIKPKTGRFPNEFVRFRYDVELWLDEAPAMERPQAVQPWAVPPLTRRATQRGETPWEMKARGGGVYVRGVPNRRLWRERAILDWLGEPGAEAPVGEIFARVDAMEEGGVDPAACLEAAEARGWRASLHWTDEAEDGRFDLCLAPAKAAQRSRAGWVEAPVRTTPERLNNLPSFSLDWETHVPVLRQALAEKLPGAVLPARFIFMHELPRLDSGEVDRESLVGAKNEAGARGTQGGTETAVAACPDYYDTSVAVVGISGVFPGAKDHEALWRNLLGGVESVRFYSEAELAEMGVPEARRGHPRFVPVRAGIEGRERFDAGFFGIPPAQAANMDPQARLLLQHAWRAIEDAGYAPRSIPQTGVYLSAGNNYYAQRLGLAERELQGVDAHEAGTFGQPGMMSAWVAYHLGLKGPSAFVQSLCCSTMSALQMAYRSLLASEVEFALVGAANVFAADRVGFVHEPGLNLSPDGRCRSFDAGANGMVEGEGVCVVLLKRARDAWRDRDPVYAVLRGIAVSNDGADKAGFAAPSVGGQVEAIRRSLAVAQVAPEAIRYVEAHGTGTPLGDSIEVAALREAYGGAGAGADGFRCGLGATKPNIGNLDTVTGLVGCVKVALSLRDGAFAPVAGFSEANPELRLEDSPFYVVREREAWRRGREPRRAAQHVYSLGGMNAHAIYEEFVPPEREAVTRRGPVLVPVSARDRERLRVWAGELAAWLEARVAAEGIGTRETEEALLADLAWTLQVGREPMEQRVVFLAEDVAELREKLRGFAERGQAGPGVWSGERAAAKDLLQFLGDEAERRRFTARHIAEARWERVAELWVRGVEVDWRELYGERTPWRMHLPAYPFRQDVHELRRAAEISTRSRSQPPQSAGGGFEGSVRAVVGELLGVAGAALAAERTFGELGCDSVLLIRLSNRLNERLGLHLTPAVFFEHATIGRLAAYLEGRDGDAAAVAAPRTGGGDAREREGIAIVGMSGKFPQAEDVGEFWRNLVEGRDCIREVPAERWSWREIYGDPNEEPGKTRVKWGGFIDGVAEFDPLFFQLSPSEAEAMDPQQRLLMMHVWLAMEDAGYSAASLAGTRTGLFLGLTESGYGRLVAEEKGRLDYGFLGIYPFGGPNRMSYFLDLKGPSEPINTGCSSSLVAVHKAVRALEEGECDVAFAGGVNVVPTPDGHVSFSRFGMLCEDGRCKAFASEANGFVRGEGVGVVVLKRLRDAEAAGDHIEAVILGTAENHGGRSNSFTAPNPSAQAELVEAAMRKAGVAPATIGYVEAHGTGTKLGDPVEVEGLKKAFGALMTGEEAGRRGFCGIGSVKSNVGHLEAAAGIAGLIKAVLQLKHRTIVRTLHCAEINPFLRIAESPFYVARENAPWPAVRDADGRELPRRAGVSSFGIGGVNAHVVLEEYPAPEVADDGAGEKVAATSWMAVLSAKTEVALRERAAELLEYLRARPGLSREEMTRVVYTLQVGRDAMAERLGWVVESQPALEAALERWLGGDAWGCFRGQASTGCDAATSSARGAVREKQDPAALLEAWVKGEKVDWGAFYRGVRPRRISLPGYPFARERYWPRPARVSESAAAVEGESAATIDWTARLREKSGQRVAVVHADAREAEEFCGLIRQMEMSAGVARAIDVRVVAEEAVAELEWAEAPETIFVLGRGGGDGGARLRKMDAMLRRKFGGAPMRVLALRAGDFSAAAAPTWTWVELDEGAEAIEGHRGLLREWLSGQPSAVKEAMFLEKRWHAREVVGEPVIGRGDTLVIVNEESARLAAAFDFEATIVDAANAAAVAERTEKVARVFDLSDLWREARGCDAEASWKLEFHQTLVGRFTECCVLHVTQGLQSFRAERMTLAGAKFAGLVKMLGAEYGHVTARTIDVEARVWSEAGELGAMLMREAGQRGGETEVCYRGAGRYVPELVAVPARAGMGEFRVRSEAVYLVSGGTSGIGLEIARHLAAKGARKLALLGIRKLPPRSAWAEELARGDISEEERARLGALVELGRKVELRVYTGAFTDRAGLRAFVDEVRRTCGPIAGVVHSAGAYPEGHAAPFVTRTAEQMRRVFEPKIVGLEALHEIFVEERLDFFVGFSSLTSAIPRLARGMSDYALANAYLDYFAAYQFHGCGRRHYRTITWIDWKETGFAARMTREETARLDAELAEIGLAAFSNADGRRFFDLAMGAGERSWVLPCHVERAAFEAKRAELLCAGNRVAVEAPRMALDRKLDEWERTLRAGEALEPEVLERVISLDEIKRLEPERIARIHRLLFRDEERAVEMESRSSDERREGGIAERVRKHLFDVLKISHVDDRRAFQDYGLDSISAMVFSNRLEKEMKRAVPPAWLIDFPTVEALTLHLERQWGERPQEARA